jgi:hypothetical protein
VDLLEVEAPQVGELGDVVPALLVDFHHPLGGEPRS